MNPPAPGSRAQPASSSSVTSISLRRFDITNQRLLDTIHDADPHCTPEIMSLLLQKNKIKLFKGLSWWEPQNPKSAAIIKSGQATWRDKTYSLDKNQQDFVLQLSELLQLDEIQSYHQFQNFLRTEVKGQKFLYDSSTSEQIFIFYCEERLAILKCVSSLLRSSMDEKYKYINEARALAKSLLEDKFPDEMIKQYTTLTKTLVPSRLSREYTERWATQCVLEQAAVLDVIFLLYYNAVPCGIPQFIKFCDLFSAESFGTRQANYSSLNEGGRAATRRIKYLCTLILIETLNLEAYCTEKIEIPNMTDLKNADKKLTLWGTMDAHGPILLAWGSILCKIGQATGYQQTNDQSQTTAWDELTPYSDHAIKATHLSAIDFLLNMLQEEGFESHEQNSLAYKSVLKGFLAILSSAFSIEHLSFYPSLVSLHVEIYSQQPLLARQFWSSYEQTPQLHSVLTLAVEKFPYQLKPLLQLLTSLAADSICANTVFWFLTSLPTYLQILPAQYHSSIEEITIEELEHRGLNGSSFLSNGYPSNHSSSFKIIPGYNYYIVTSPVEIDMITIPVGTIGRLMSSRDSNQDQIGHSAFFHSNKSQETYIVQWDISHSAWQLLLGIVDSFLTRFSNFSASTRVAEDELSRVSAIIDLMATLFTHHDVLPLALSDHLIENTARTFGSYLSVEDVSILPRLFQILHSCAFLSRPPMKLLTSTLKCIKGIAKSQPAETWNFFRRGLIETADQNSLMTPGPIRHLLEYECAQGSYPVTIAWLDLVVSLISYLQRWPNLGDIHAPSLASRRETKMDTEDFMPCLLYIQTALFSQYETWRYVSILEKSQIGLRILLIFQQLLHDVPPNSPHSHAAHIDTNASIMETSSMPVDSTQTNPTSSSNSIQEYLLNSLLFDVSFHTNLLNVVSIGPSILEYNMRRVKSGFTFELLVKTGLSVLERVLLLKQRATFSDQSAASISSSDAETPMSQGQGSFRTNTSQMEAGITPLESSVLQRKVGKSGLDLVYVIASYISYSYDSIIPLKATQLLTILCTLSHRSNVSDIAPALPGSSSSQHPIPQPTSSPISLVAYFGSMAETLRAEFLWKLSDNRELSELRIAILRLITDALATQPGLAELFINIQVDDNESAQKSKAPLSVNAPGLTDKSQTDKLPSRVVEDSSIPTSCVNVVLTLLCEEEQRSWYQENNPRLLAEALAFLQALWQVASDHFAIIGEIRSKPKFWSKLLSCLSHPKGEAISKTMDFDSDEEVMILEDKTCYQTIVNAHVFKIIALEIFFVPINGDLDADLISELSRMGSSKGKVILSWLDTMTECAFNPTHKELLIKTLSSLKISMESLTHFSTHRVFGSHFNYDIPLLQKKLGLLLSLTLSEDGPIYSQPALISTDPHTSERINVIDKIATINLELSKIESQLFALHSVHTLIHMVLLRQPKLGWLDQSALLNIIKLLAGKIGNEKRDSASVMNNIKEMSTLFHLLVRQWSKYLPQITIPRAQNSSDASQKSEKKSFTPLNPPATSSAPSQLSEDDSQTVSEVVMSITNALVRLPLIKESGSIVLTLLSSIHILLKSIKIWNESMQFASLPLIPVVVGLLERRKLFNVSLSILQVIATHTVHPTTLLRGLTEGNTLGVLVHNLYKSLSSQIEPEQAEVILFLFLALANSAPSMSEALAAQGIIRCVCSEPWAAYLRDRMTAYTSNGERNPWHRVWTMIIALITRILRVLGHLENFVEQALDFVLVHNSRITRSLDIYTTNYQAQDAKQPSQMDSSAPVPISNLNSFSGYQTPFKTSTSTSNPKSSTLYQKPVMTIGNLEETERTTALIFQLGHFRGRWRVALDSPGNPNSLAEFIEGEILLLFQRVALLVSHPSDIVLSAKAISTQERKSLSSPASAAPATSQTPSMPHFNAKEKVATIGATQVSKESSQTQKAPAIVVTADKPSAASEKAGEPKEVAKSESKQPSESKETNESKQTNESKDTPTVASTSTSQETNGQPGTRMLAQSQSISKPPSVPKPVPLPVQQDQQEGFYQRVEFSLYRILRNTISLVRLLTPAVFRVSDDEMNDPETLVPIFEPLPEATIAPVPTLGILTVLITTCVGTLKKLSSSNETSPSFAMVDTHLSLNNAAKRSNSSVSQGQEDILSLIVYTIECAVYILISHIHLYVSPNYNELVRRRVRDEIGYELESTLSRLNRDFVKLAHVEGKSDESRFTFLHKAGQYLQNMQRR